MYHTDLYLTCANVPWCEGVSGDEDDDEDGHGDDEDEGVWLLNLVHSFCVSLFSPPPSPGTLRLMFLGVK